MKKLIKRLIIFVFVIILTALSFYAFYMLPRKVVPVLMYHSISYNEESSLNVTPENFSRQMEYLSKSGYKVISLDDYVEGLKNNTKFHPKTVVITFDDGFEDNYLYAFPVLAKHDMPATIFLITGYVDSKKEYLRWDQIKVMLERGIDFGGHTRNNEYLPAITDQDKLRDEIYAPRADIEENTGHEAEYFCYPIGGFNHEVKAVVKEAGYKGACTTNRGTGRFNRDVYELKRVKVTNSDTTKPMHFWAKLSGYYNLFRSLKNSQ